MSKTIKSPSQGSVWDPLVHCFLLLVAIVFLVALGLSILHFAKTEQRQEIQSSLIRHEIVRSFAKTG